MNGGLKVLIGITILAGVVLLLGLLKLISLSSGGASFLEGLMIGCGVGFVISWLLQRGEPRRTRKA